MAYACTQCPACLAGLDASCSSGKISGYYFPGTFQQYAVAPAHYVTPIPDGLPSDVAAPMLCGGVTVRNMFTICCSVLTIPGLCGSQEVWCAAG
jgi:alcohol dehydrogenase, propanol-preferring